jgi:phenylalanyl-tRNA synthetase alpha chain
VPSDEFGRHFISAKILLQSKNMKEEIVINSKEEKAARSVLDKRTDAEALRMRRYLDMPDLSRTGGSPISELVKKIVALPDFSDFDVVRVPEIVPARESFDLFNFPPDHPARSRSDTYFVDDKNVLRTHTTVMWYYWLGLKAVREKMQKGKAVGALCYGKVYRKDEIDREHMNVFHQIDGWYLCRREERMIGLDDLKDVLIKIAKAIYGADIKYRFNKDEFPYTDPSLEMVIEVGGRWVEVLGSGAVRSVVLDNFGVDSKIWNGWAFGFGIERLAILSMDLPDIRLLWSEDERVKRQLKLGNKYKEVSKYPPITRDISFVVKKDFVPNNYFDLIRDIGGDLVEEVSLLDKYENPEKFGSDKMSYTYRIIYRSNERTLMLGEIEPLQAKITEETRKQFNAEIR